MNSDSNSPISGPASVSLFRIEKPTSNIPGKSLIPFPGPINDGEDIVLESPSVSNNHPTPDAAAAGYADVAGLNTGDAAAFNSGNSDHSATYDFPIIKEALATGNSQVAPRIGTPLGRSMKKTIPIPLLDAYRSAFSGELKDAPGLMRSPDIFPDRWIEEPITWPDYVRETLAKVKANLGIVDEPSPSSDNPRIFFADEPRPALWHILSRDQQRAIESFAFGDLEAGDRLADEDIAVEILPDTAAGWHDTHPIVRVCIDGNEWCIEFEERSFSEGNGNEADFGSEDNENEAAAAQQPSPKSMFSLSFRTQLEARGINFEETPRYLVVNSDDPGVAEFRDELQREALASQTAYELIQRLS